MTYFSRSRAIYRIYLVRISQEQFNTGAPFLQGRCIITKSRSSSKMGHLDLLFKVTAIYRIYLVNRIQRCQPLRFCRNKYDFGRKIGHYARKRFVYEKNHYRDVRHFKFRATSLCFHPNMSENSRDRCIVINSTSQYGGDERGFNFSWLFVGQFSP